MFPSRTISITTKERPIDRRVGVSSGEDAACHVAWLKPVPLTSGRRAHPRGALLLRAQPARPGPRERGEEKETTKKKKKRKTKTKRKKRRTACRGEGG
ncbi:unnamed protein product [Arctogadus glacialis]